jgi:phosphopentomutase
MRAILMVLDGLGVGAAPDADEYGDAGADTLRHIIAQCPEMRLPTLWSLGLGNVLNADNPYVAAASFGRMRERSRGKDSTTGHWELAGVNLEHPFTVFRRFPEDLIHKIEADSGVSFIGNIAGSGTEIIHKWGRDHIRTKCPILYTSADSVLQIAAHENVIPVTRLYEICEIARKHADSYRIGRVIARPFIGEPDRFERTSRRHDFSMLPPPTVLDAIAAAGYLVKSIGKVADLFAGRGITESYPTKNNLDGMQRIESVWADTTEGLVFANLVDFDTHYGHRRDPVGYARALMQFDEWLKKFLSHCVEDDLVIVTADHGNDPTFRGSDHTREEVPLLVRHRRTCVNLGRRGWFGDVAASIAAHFCIEGEVRGGQSFIEQHHMPART